jgi:DNA-binding NarL/FixJ family response regulator
MQVILVGTAAERARLRAMLPDDIRIAGEASTLAEAGAGDHDADALLVAAAHRGNDDDAPAPEALTPREREVLELLSEGLPNKAIATRLGISDQTAKFHVASIYGKLGAANRTEAVRIALRRGLLTI